MHGVILTLSLGQFAPLLLNGKFKSVHIACYILPRAESVHIARGQSFALLSTNQSANAAGYRLVSASHIVDVDYSRR